MPIDPGNQDVEKAQDEEAQVAARRRCFSLWLPDILRKSRSPPEEVEEEWNKTTVTEIESNPEGWPRLAAVIDSDPSFMIFRRFGYLRTRLLVWHQDRLREIESTLEGLDWEDFNNEPYKRALCCRQGDDRRIPAKRRHLFQQLSEELKRYDDLLRRCAEVRQYDAPSHRDREAVATFIWNDGELSSLDRSYIRHVDDLVALCSDKESSWIHGVLLALSLKIAAGRSLIRYCFRSSTQRRKLNGGSVLRLELIDKERFDAFVAFIFTMILVFLIMGPVMILYKIRNMDGYRQILVALAFASMFAGLCSSATSAKRHEVFAATAAYCAVLLVFLGQNASGSNNKMGN
ncbi:hypothetical protein HRR90_008033 [Exophiala dermatitidis]|nr:hypothetical protein HRR75_007784 [Exophiala dermatitidis]KAJ4506042.1 hypothetical protein HRR74_008472 [Exophiala dermatitidis]KAJ4556060.1 hypothetical protein HRR78_001718 [Exophiala dermatitidis]KAJ4563623.1 hypothetical protein HRR81_008458 [Exophiala dermatitidis]KAJ4603521.1 hypothetical protein HRR85_008583 [Exophiala dermatitidis]